MKRIKALAVFNALSLIAQLPVVYFVQEKWINYRTIGEVFTRYESLFTPALFIFSVWGIIYTALGIMCLYQIVMAYKHDKLNFSNIDLGRMSGYLIIANLSGILWLISWVQERLALSLLSILIQLVCLAIIHKRLGIFDRSAPAGSKTCTQFPLSIYLGWIVILTMINANSWLVSIGWNAWGLNPSQWTLILITLLVALTLFMIFGRHNIYFGIITAWAMYGIIEKVSSVNSNSYDMVTNTAWLGFGLILLSTVMHLFSSHYKKPHDIFPSAAAPLK